MAEVLPVQIHGMDADEFFAGEGDVDAAREIVATVGAGAELFLYHGDRHLFADSSLPSYDAEAAELLTERVLGFLSDGEDVVALRHVNLLRSARGRSPARCEPTVVISVAHPSPG